MRTSSAYPEDKRCAHCSTLMDRTRYRSSDAAWRARRYCNARCKALAYRKEQSSKPKTCELCEEPFVRAAHDTWQGWRQRRYCGPSCAKTARDKRCKRGRVDYSHGHGELKGVQLQRFYRRRIDRQVAWVFEIERGAYLRSALIRELRAAGDTYGAEMALKRALPTRLGALMEGTRRRVVERIRSLGVV